MSTEPDYPNATPPTPDELAVLKARQDAVADALALDNEVRAQRIRKQAQALVAAEGEPSIQDDTPALLVDGATFLLDIPEGVPAVWGRGTEVLWAQGEALLIAGPPGVGKTTLISHVLVSMLGIGGTHVLGLPVAPAHKVLYLAMDRPQQIARALSRHVRAEHRAILAEHLVVWKGPPPADLAKHPHALLALAEQAEADVVVLDSLKDAAIGLSEDEVGAGYNRARQLLLAHSVEVVELHHTRKHGAGGTSTPSLSDVYGSTWITSGAGSVLMLSGEPGDPIVDMRHLKQPAGEVGPYRLLHDQDTGAMTVEHATDLYAIAVASGGDGLTAKRAAVAMFEKDTPSRAQTEKARRKLDRLVKAGSLVREDGQEGPEGGKPTATWHPVGSNHGQSRSDTEPQVRAITGGISGSSNHAPEKQSRSDTEPQVRAITEPITAITQGAITNCTPPLRGAGRCPRRRRTGHQTGAATPPSTQLSTWQHDCSEPPRSVRDESTRHQSDDRTVARGPGAQGQADDHNTTGHHPLPDLPPKAHPWLAVWLRGHREQGGPLRRAQRPTWCTGQLLHPHAHRGADPMTADQLRYFTARLDDFDARLAVIEAAHADLMRLLDGVPARCRAPGCAHLTVGALCPTHTGRP